MKFYEINQPYYALIKAASLDDACEIYNEVVANISHEEFTAETTKLEKDKAEYKMRKIILTEAGKFLFDDDLIQEQIRRLLTKKRREVLLIDGHLL